MARAINPRNQWSDNQSQTYGAKHIRMRKVRGRAAQHRCYGCPAQAAEWAQLHTEDGNDPWADYAPLCRPCHRRYDGTPAAVAASNRMRLGETRKQYVIRNPDRYYAAQAARIRKCEPGCDCGRHWTKAAVERKRREGRWPK